MRLAVIGVDDPLTERVTQQLREVSAAELLAADRVGEAIERLAELEIDTVVHLPVVSFRERRQADLAAAEQLFRDCPATVRRFVLISSAAIYEPTFSHPGWIPERPASSLRTRHPIAAKWIALESLAERYLGRRGDLGLTVLRPVAVPTAGGHGDGDDYFSRLLTGHLALCPWGHDPSIQLLDPEDLAAAVRGAVEAGRDGVFHVAPDGVIPLRAALRIAGVRRIPLPYALLRLGRMLLRRSRHGGRELDYLRYSWTVSGEASREALGFVPRHSCAEVLARLRPPAAGSGKRVADGPAAEPFDDFGLDKRTITRLGRVLFAFLYRCYWRIETRGLEHVPASGRAVLTGMHRGFMPWDAIMVIDLLVKRLGRYPRFLVHPGLLKFPFLFDLMTKLGAVLANRRNADRIMERYELLGYYPEGIRGAFSLYRDAYELKRFGRDEFVRVALRHRAPIVPFVIVGSAEVFPIFGKIEWGWWKRYARWPFIPLTPTFPLLPLPLPSKWHLRFLPPLHVESEYPPAAAEEPAAVRAISREVRQRMSAALQEMLRRRKSIFFGSIFHGDEE
ncbi:MAG: hypothetical protein GY856_05320 [bacterium]|nr:hypothetical protein [bacterium]